MMVAASCLFDSVYMCILSLSCLTGKKTECGERAGEVVSSRGTTLSVCLGNGAGKGQGEVEIPKG